MINQKDSSAVPKTQVTSEACTQRPMEDGAQPTQDISEMLLIIPNQRLMEEILSRNNLKAAHEAVLNNKGCPGIDGMPVEKLREHVYAIWPKLRRELLAGTYKPQPVKQVEIPKPCGGVRKLQIPTVLDRFILQAIHQVLQRYLDPTFSEYSYGFRPGKSAIDAIKKSKEYVAAGYTIVADIDLDKFFDRVNHNKLMSELYKRIKDTRLLTLIRSYLNAGAICKGLFLDTTEGTSQGSPLSPLLSNLMLDLLDQELEKRGHKFARYADDCNIYVRTKKAGVRVMASISDFITRKLKLKVNKEKSAVDKASKRKFLGFTIRKIKDFKICISKESLKRVKDRIREITAMTAGRSMESVTMGLSSYLGGWKGYYGHIETPSVFKDLDGWIRRRLRCLILYQRGKGKALYRELMQRGISEEWSWRIAWSSKGFWALSRCKQVSIAFTNKVMRCLGFRPLYDG